MSEFLMPSLGADMSAGTLVAWRKKKGDYVKRGDIIAEVETEKAVIEIEVYSTGVIDEILVQPGEKVPVGTPLAVIREEGREEDLRLRVSPLARKVAQEKGVDLKKIQGTGTDGAIRMSDIEKAAEAKSERATVVPAEISVDRKLRMRQTIASAMARSKREIPHYYLGTTINMNPAVAWLSNQNLNRAPIDRILYGVLLIKAVALALKEVPELNAIWENDQVVLKNEVHVGVAISLRQGGLVAPAIHQTDKLSLDELMGRLSDLVKRARSNSLKASELSDPTITVSNMGEQGVEILFGIIYPPQVALVGFGKLLERPWSVEGKVVSLPVITATLSGDHRVSDGHRGGIFLSAVERLLQSPEDL
ncbi:MAG: dihydrolipoamide acetyltransferase family protein [Nitrospiria bacterium]